MSPLCAELVIPKVRDREWKEERRKTRGSIGWKWIMKQKDRELWLMAELIASGDMIEARQAGFLPQRWCFYEGGIYQDCTRGK